MKTYNYNPLKAIWCYFFGHRWAPYDFEIDKDGTTTNIDKCVTCYKEYRRPVWSRQEPRP